MALTPIVMNCFENIVLAGTSFTKEQIAVQMMPKGLDAMLIHPNSYVTMLSVDLAAGQIVFWFFSECLDHGLLQRPITAGQDFKPHLLCSLPKYRSTTRLCAESYGFLHSLPITEPHSHLKFPN